MTMMEQRIELNKRMVILQTEAQTIHYKNNWRQDDDLVLPIGPEAMYEIEKNGWAFCSLGDLWNREQYDAEREVSQKRLDDLIDVSKMVSAYSTIIQALERAYKKQATLNARRNQPVFKYLKNVVKALLARGSR